MATAEVSESEVDSGKWRRWIARTLLVVFCVSMALASVSIWSKNQIEDTDRYMRTVGPLASHPAIQEAIIHRVSDRFSSFLDDATTRDLLGDRQQILAGPIRNLLDQFVEDTVRSFVTSDKFPQYWNEANELVHPRVSAILTGSDTEHMTTADGKITLDLTPLVEAIKNEFGGRGFDVFSRITGKELDPQIVIIDSPELAKVQDEVDLLATLAYVFPIVGLLAVGGYIWLSSNRRSAVVWSGLGLAIAMGGLLLLLSFGRSLYIDGLDSDVRKDAATAFFDIVGKYFRYGVRALAVLGLVLAAVAIATRPGSWLRQERAEIARQLSEMWHSLRSRARRLHLEEGWMDRHRAGLLGALMAICVIAIIWGTKTSLGWAITLAAIVFIGVSANRWLLRPAPAIPAGPIPANLTIEPVPTASRPQVDETQTGREASNAALMQTVRDLTLEDLQMLERLAVGLRETSHASAARPQSSRRRRTTSEA